MFPLIFVCGYTTFMRIWCRDQDWGLEYGPFMVLRFLKELQRALLCFWRMKDASVLHASRDSQLHKE